MEVYVDDMLVKAPKREDHLKNLAEAFSLLRQYRMQLNPRNTKSDGQSSISQPELAERAISYAQGLPLALTVVGSWLYGRPIDKWQAALDGFKSRDIEQVLKVSYDALPDRVKDVFLDIACFFNGKSTNYVIEILEDCDLNPTYDIEVLKEKALISVEGNDIHMHDLLEEMGKDIVHQESPNEPGARSRLWFYKDVHDVITNNTGTNKIKGIVANFPNKGDEICLYLESFSVMKNLKIIIICNACLSGEVEYLPNNLRVLQYVPENFSTASNNEGFEAPNSLA
ncbi:hypothetical protein L3X38_000013 [Prunus dulcis]|uniref:Disease resistance protein Roq1-like winged-helix domain-containing protein n=1 Tax=Prunus dulcis TaxID=3755 RepID=A0AAD4YK04_PRUDU|nr:hypothetical protein L3X38_000013 [Prunus dulcis]